MKILVVFIDMIRVNRLALVNENIINKTPLDLSLKKLGGTFYTNCFSQGPDTPRAMATFATGKTPTKNGCDTRLKWPRDFLNKDLKTVYDLVIEKDYKMTFFSNPNERQFGMFPEHITNLDIHNENYELDKYLESLEIEDNHFIFISLPDFHWSIDDNGSTKHGEKRAIEDVSKSFDIIFNNLNKDDFDHIFLFSDHGFRFAHEYKTQPNYMLLNRDRTNTLLLHRKKGEGNLIKFNHKLCSIASIFYTLDEIINHTKSVHSLFSKKEEKYIIIEDHLKFITSINLPIEIWAVAFKEKIYVRDLENGYLIDRNNKVEFGVKHELDFILENESSFGKSNFEFQKVHKYNELILKQTKFMYGGKRKKIHRFLHLLNYIKDLFEGKKAW